jgi:hypothetical protein
VKLGRPAGEILDMPEGDVIMWTAFFDLKNEQEAEAVERQRLLAEADQGLAEKRRNK